MPGRRFLDVARDVVAGGTEYHWRGASVDAYYALFLEVRDALLCWGFPIPRRENVHSWVRLRFVYSNQPMLNDIGESLDYLGRLRNQASYDLSPLPAFASSQEAHSAILDATQALGQLDAVDNDPTQRATAIASIRP